MKSMIMEFLRKLKALPFYLVTCFLPVNKGSVIFSSYCGRGYGDNPRYIAETIHSLYPNIKLFWAVRDKKSLSSLPDYIEPCRIGSLKYYYAMNTSGVWVDNCRNYYLFGKKSGSDVYSNLARRGCTKEMRKRC